MADASVAHWSLQIQRFQNQLLLRLSLRMRTSSQAERNSAQLSALVDKLLLWADNRNLRARVESTKEDLQQRQSSQAEQTERLLQSSKRQNILVFGVAESASLCAPFALIEHISQLLSEGSSQGGTQHSISCWEVEVRSE